MVGVGMPAQWDMQAQQRTVFREIREDALALSIAVASVLACF